MLGIALVQLLPHAYDILQDGRAVGLTMLSGLLVMFFLIRIFDFHHHDVPLAPSACDKDDPIQAGLPESIDSQPSGDLPTMPPASGSPVAPRVDAGPHPGGEQQTGQPAHDCGHEHHGQEDHGHGHGQHGHGHGQHGHRHGHAEGHGHAEVHGHPSDPMVGRENQSLAWTGLLLGLGLHSIMDGIALAAALKAETIEATSVVAGLGIFLAIALHKPLDSMSIASLMRVSHWGKAEQFWVNMVFALSCPLAAILVFFGVNLLPADTVVALGFALAFSAGTFLCISLGDLLPELHFHSHDRLLLSVVLLVGIGLAIALEFLPMHKH